MMNHRFFNLIKHSKFLIFWLSHGYIYLFSIGLRCMVVVFYGHTNILLILLKLNDSVKQLLYTVWLWMATLFLV